MESRQILTFKGHHKKKNAKVNKNFQKHKKENQNFKLEIEILESEEKEKPRMMI